MAGARFEAAFGADRTADPLSWSWTDLTARTRTGGDATTVVRRGGRESGASLSQPGAVSMLLGNADAALTPRNPVSVWYPNVHRGLPVRCYVNTGDRHLELTGAAGSRASTPDHASLDITGELSGAVEFDSPLRHPPQGVSYELFGKYNTTGNQRSWLLFLFGGRLWLNWSTNGSATAQLASRMSIPTPDSGPVTVGWVLTVNIFGVAHAVQWYAIKGDLADLLADPAAATLGAAVSGSGTTSIFSSTALLEVGDISGLTSVPGFVPYPGKIRRVQLRSGNLTSGTVVANPDFTTQTVGASSFADSTGKTWTVNSPADITDRKYRFVGELDANRPGWPANGKEGTAQVEWDVAGVLRRMRQGDPPLESSIRRLALSKVNAPSLAAYWPFEDGPDATSVASALDGGALLTITGQYSLGQSDEMFPAAVSVLNISSGQSAYMSAPIPRIADVTGVNWQVTRFFRIDDPAVNPAITQLMVVRTTGRVATWHIAINNTSLSILGRDAVDATVVTTSVPADARMFDTWAMIILDVTDNGTNVDWAVTLIPTPLGVGFGTSGTFSGAPGVPHQFRNNCVAPPSGISLSHLIVSEGNAAGWLAPADIAYVGEPAAQRVFRLCQEQGIPVAVDGIYSVFWDDAAAAGSRLMGPQRPKPLLELLGESAAVEAGILGESRELLGLTYRAGSTLHNQTAALSVTAMQPFTPADDDQDLVNDATVTREQGSGGREIDQTSIDAHGYYNDSRTVNTESDWQARNHASWWLHEATWPEMRYPDVTFELAAVSGAPLGDWLDTNIGDVAEAVGLPDEHVTPSVSQLVDGYVEEISPFHWRVTANGRPAGPWEVGVLGDTAMGKLDTAGSELASGITATATSLSVATTLGPIWTADDTEDGFDIDIGGERMTVTDIAGSSSPQTFTVTRSVNGVVKSHSSGAVVRLWRPSVLALEGL